ncbi:MAG: DUF1573 domain-containing protein [Bacteroidetes bacterium]|nr:DUF1573 domain-containing protein [Bacteroidota bacterium]
MMKKTICYSFAFLILLINLPSKIYAQEITLAKKVFNVGLVRWGKKGSYRLAYKNTSKGEVSMISAAIIEGSSTTYKSDAKGNFISVTQVNGISPKLIYFNISSEPIKSGDSGSLEMLIDPREVRDSFSAAVELMYSGGNKIRTVVKGLVKAPAWADRKGALIFMQNNFCDLDKITVVEEKTCTFKFQNIGDEILVLSDVQSSGDSLQLTWPKEPIQPGKSGEITAKFTPVGKGAFRKYITVKTNVRDKQAATLTLVIKGKLPPK